jgi:hypothetical protein
MLIYQRVGYVRTWMVCRNVARFECCDEAVSWMLFAGIFLQHLPLEVVLNE